MPSVLKYPGKNSPGIIVFTSNEYFFGALNSDKKLHDRLVELHKVGRWQYGVHINGSFHGSQLEFSSLISFVLCADASLNFMESCSVPIIELAAEFFVEINPLILDQPRRPKWDVAIISRISDAKRFNLALDLLGELFIRRPNLRVCIVAQTNSRSFSEKRYVLAASKRLKALLKYDLTLLISQVELFGNFPITQLGIQSILADSSLLIVSSAREGGPRVLTEAFTLGVRCVVFEDLKSNLQKYFKLANVSLVSKNIPKAAKEITDLLVRDDCVKGTNFFSNVENNEKLKNSILNILKKKDFAIDGVWDLSNLSLRLPGHSRLGDQQILYSCNLLLKWLNTVNYEESNFSADNFFMANLHLYKQPIRSKLLSALFWVSRVVKSKLARLHRPILENIGN